MSQTEIIEIMLGFEIKINDEESISVAAENVLSICLNMRYEVNNDCLNIGGNDSDFFRLEWPEKKLEMGDKIKISVADICNVSPPSIKIPADRKELIERYYLFKKELEDKNMI